jgi:putative hemolysin
MRCFVEQGRQLSADDLMPYWAPPTSTGIANPASVNCLKQGGTLAIEKRGGIGESSVCYFEDNRQCKEWVLFRGECPVGGLKVTGYITEAACFCAITGGEYTITGNSNADN